MKRLKYSDEQIDQILVNNNLEVKKLIESGFSIDESGKFMVINFSDNKINENTQSPTTYYGSYEVICLICGAHWDEHHYSSGIIVDGRKCNC